MKNLKTSLLAALLLSALGGGSAYAQASQSAVKVTVLARSGTPLDSVAVPTLAPPPGPPIMPPTRPPRKPPSRS